MVPEAAAVMTPSPMVMLVPKTASSSRACCTLLLFLTAAAALSANGFVFRPLQCRDRALHKLLQVSYQHQSQAERLQGPWELKQDSKVTILLMIRCWVLLTRLTQQCTDCQMCKREEEGEQMYSSIKP